MQRLILYAKQLWRRHARRSLVVPALTTLVALLAQASHAAQVAPSLTIELPAQNEVGRPISIVLTAQAVTDIGGYELTLLYDTTALTLHGLRLRNSEVRTAGRGVEPLTAERPDGLSIGVYSCPFAECVRPAGGSPREPRGASGAVRLAEVLLMADAPGVVEVRLADAKFVAADGTVIPVTLPVQTLLVQVGSPQSQRYPAPAVRLQPAPLLPITPHGPFDLTGDGLVNYADSVVAAVDWTMLRYGGVVCEAGAQRSDDVNHDGCLDIIDLQLLTHHFTDPPQAVTETPTADASATATTTTIPADTPTPAASSTPAVTATVTATADTFSPSHAVYLPHIMRASFGATAPTQTPTASVTPTDTASATATTRATLALTETPRPTQSPTPAATEILSATPTPTNSLTSTPVATATHTVTPTVQPSGTDAPTATPSPTVQLALTGTLTGTATITGTPIPTGLSATPEAEPDMTLYVMDRFNRQVSNGWGVAARGGNYTLHGAPGRFGVNGSATILMPGPRSENRVELLSVSALNVDARFRVQTNKPAWGGGQSAYFAARRLGPGDLYLGRVRFINDAVELVAYRLLAGEEIRLSAPFIVPQLVHRANTDIWVRTQVVGAYPTTIRMRAWAHDQYEPGDWQYSVTDQEPKLQVPGAVGLRTYLSLTALNAPVLFTFDDLVVNHVLPS